MKTSVIEDEHGQNAERHIILWRFLYYLTKIHLSASMRFCPVMEQREHSYKPVEQVTQVNPNGIAMEDQMASISLPHVAPQALIASGVLIQLGGAILFSRAIRGFTSLRRADGSSKIALPPLHSSFRQAGRSK